MSNILVQYLCDGGSTRASSLQDLSHTQRLEWVAECTWLHKFHETSHQGLQTVLSRINTQDTVVGCCRACFPRYVINGIIQHLLFELTFLASSWTVSGVSPRRSWQILADLGTAGVLFQPVDICQGTLVLPFWISKVAAEWLSGVLFDKVRSPDEAHVFHLHTARLPHVHEIHAGVLGQNHGSHMFSHVLTCSQEIYEK